MNPQLEYYLRNKITAPYIHHGNGKAILYNSLKSKSYDRYSFLDIHAINKGDNDGVNIGRFNITLFSPSKSGDDFFKNSDSWTVYWSEYSSFIETKVKKWRDCDWRVLSHPDDLKVACWELLAYSQDVHFSDLSIDILDLNCSLLDFNTPVSTRAFIVDKLIKTISSSNFNHYSCKNILEAWCNLNKIVQSGYAHWLAKLVNR